MMGNQSRLGTILFVFLCSNAFAQDGVQNDPPWHLDRLTQESNNLDGRYYYESDGSTQRIFIVDSGVDNHAEFDDPNGVIRISRIGPDPYGTGNIDQIGHGTPVASAAAGLVSGVAKRIEVVPLRVSDSDCSTNKNHLAAAFAWIRDNGRHGDVVNVSLAGVNDSTIQGLVEQVIDNGITVVWAAGNEKQNQCSYSYVHTIVDDVIVVGASTKQDARWEYSNHGECVDVFAPGHEVQLAETSGACESDPPPPCSSCGGDPQGASLASSSLRSGTSYAAPQVAAVAALIYEQGLATNPAEIQQWIIDNSLKGILSDVRPGTPNRLLHVPSDAPPEPPAAPEISVSYLGCSGYQAVYVVSLTSDTGNIDKWRAQLQQGSYAAAGNWYSVHNSSNSSFSISVDTGFYFSLRAKTVKDGVESKFTVTPSQKAPACGGGGWSMQ